MESRQGNDGARSPLRLAGGTRSTALELGGHYACIARGRGRVPARGGQYRQQGAAQSAARRGKWRGSVSERETELRLAPPCGALPRRDCGAVDSSPFPPIVSPMIFEPNWDGSN